ncbi:MAG: MATE family efflux transporter [Alicyclobacillus sp.]|nr:MATE family efflux transporter [Alicyclobacillus sp.]
MPLLLGNVLQSLNGSINAVWIGHFLGPSAFAGTSNANNIMFLMLGTIFGVGMAATILVAQSIGARDVDQAKRVVGSSFLFFLTFALLVGIAGYLLSADILRAMHTPPDALRYATSYLRIIFAGVPFMFLYNFIMTILRGAGDSKTPFYFLILSSVLDAGLNPLFIFGLGPFPRLGVAGSALATLIGQVVSLACILLYLYRTQHFLCLRRGDGRYLRFNGVIIASLIRKGIPMGLQMIVVSSSGIAMINLINSFGSVATAAFGAAMQISNYVQMPAMAIGGAVSTIAAQNVGAGKWDRVHRTTLLGVLVNVVMTGVLVAAIYLFNHAALMLFVDSERVAAIGMRINAITLWGFVLFGVTFVISGVVRSTGAVTVPLLITFFALWCVRIPLSYVFAHRFGLDALWWSFPIGFVLGTGLSAAYYRFGKWRSARMMKQGPSGGPPSSASPSTPAGEPAPAAQ